MQRIVALILILLIPLQAYAGAPFTSAMGGVWHGVGLQSNGAEWNVELTLGPTRGAVAYPSLQCGGVFRYRQVMAASLIAVETIEYGLETCYETGHVSLASYDETRILFVWCGEEDHVRSLAVLARGPLVLKNYEADYDATLDAILALEGPLDDITCTGSKWLGV